MRILLEGGNAAVGVEDGCLVTPEGRFDVELRLPAGELRPGLINAHDHLHRNHYGRLGAPPYPNAYAWGRDIHVRYAAAIDRGRAWPRRQALLAGAWKNLLSGVTCVVHHDRWESDFEQDFPLRVLPVRCAHSPGLEPDLRPARQGPWCLHLAEGTDPEAAEEVRWLDRRGFLGPDLIAVHVVGADDDGVARLRRAGTAVVWCPTSNLFLFGQTAPAQLLEPGTDVLLGSDSLLTATGTVLDEMGAARRLGLVSDARLEAALAATAARRFGLSEPTLAPGAPADLVLLRRPMVHAGLEDVAAVVARGVLRVLDPAMAPALGGDAEYGQLIVHRGVERWVDQRSTVPRTICHARSA